MKFITTTEKIEVENYPYGFRLKTTLFDEVEFNPKKGYRRVTSTINPKNGKLNAPKKSTYSPLIVRYYGEENHIKSLHFSFNGSEDINKGINFINDNFDLFSPEEITYFYTTILSMLLVDMKATVIYCGVDFNDLKPLYDEIIKNMKLGIKNPNMNLFKLNLNIESIEALKKPEFNPFR